MSRRDPEIIDAEFEIVQEAPRSRRGVGWVEPAVVAVFQITAAIGVLAFGRFVLYPLVFGLLG